MNLQFSGTPGRDEFMAAVKLANRPVSGNTGLRAEVWAVILAGGALSIAIGLRLLFWERNLRPGVFLLALGAALCMYAWNLRSAADRAWSAGRGQDAHREGTITGEGVEIRSPVEQVRVQWAGFTGYGEYRGVVLLFQGPAAHMFPASFFQSEEEWRAFRDFVADRLPRTHGVEPGLFNRSNRWWWILLLLSALAMLGYSLGGAGR